jgi:hypothetical protein
LNVKHSFFSAHKQGAGIVIAFCILLIAFVLRVRLMNNDLEIDEVWSLKLASSMRAPFAVFWLHSDNNHYLNTLWLYALGPLQSFWMYRIPALLSGIGLVGAVMHYGWKKHPLTGCVLGLLLAVSPTLIFFSVEARGYSLMLLFGFLSYREAEQVMKLRSVRHAVFCAIFMMLAFLSQLMVIHLYLAMLVWSTITLIRHERDRWLLVIMHLPIVLLLLFLAITDFSHLVIGGGPTFTLLQFCLGAVGILFASPVTGILPMFLGLMSLFFLVWKIDSLMRVDASKAWALMILFFISPILWILFFHPTILYPRYILISLFFVLLLSGMQLAEWIRSRHKWRAHLGLLIISLWLASCTLGQLSLNRNAHGYTDALAIISKNADTQPITIGSDTDFRTKLLLWFYTQRIKTETSIRYIDAKQQKKVSPEFWIIDRDIESPLTTVMINTAIYNPLSLPINGTKWLALKKTNL